MNFDFERIQQMSNKTLLYEFVGVLSWMYITDEPVECANYYRYRSALEEEMLNRMDTKKHCKKCQ